MMRRLSIFAAISSVVFGLAGAVAAHPDIAASVRLIFALEGTRLTGLTERLAFDAATSARLLARFDADRDGVLSDAEVSLLADELLPRLAERNAYTELRLDGRSLSLPEPAISDLQLHDGYLGLRLEYRFPEQPEIRASTLGVLLRDRDLVIAFRPDPTMPAIITPDVEGACSTSIEARPDEAYFGGLVTPSLVTLTCR
ncbi:DUF1007 family protein [Rhizobium wuzhouense]|uniref:EF-hand domain-containing protein n=1 Tax=Rhizobium wuzhouense TaxID=1986026 RepID=A0ABX5NXV0_9HYPH|nr:DUF1007 family protein [Rhizobium wuzhouense]PYB77459.1 hypothetical protein DMY87_03620 [Rhizobium wuzhouense]